MSENDYLPFLGRVAIVTGGARGIGKAIAELFAKRGANVVIGDLQTELAEATARDIGQSSGRDTLAISVDVSNFASAKELIDKTLIKFNHIDILVNNAGITRDTLIMRMEEDDWDAVLNVNLKGVFNCSKAVIRSMIKQRYGKIINISSVSGQIGQVGQTNYSASKAGIIGFTKSLAREVASRNINVNAIAPGMIPTSLTEELPEELKQTILEATPLGRMGKPEEIAFAVAFLASDEASYITGQVLAVDGGMVMM